MLLFSISRLSMKIDIGCKKSNNEPPQTGSFNGKLCKIISNVNEWIKTIRERNSFMLSCKAPPRGAL